MNKFTLIALTLLLSANSFATTMVCSVNEIDDGLNAKKVLGNIYLNEQESKVVYQTSDRSLVVFASTGFIKGPDIDINTISVSVQEGNDMKQNASTKFGEVLSIYDKQRKISIDCFPLAIHPL
ncbi:MAG: hypothetical protein ACXVCP_09520 [Bdellovibrio sp.]